jgi:hypothetical protein
VFRFLFWCIVGPLFLLAAVIWVCLLGLWVLGVGAQALLVALVGPERAVNGRHRLDS